MDFPVRINKYLALKNYCSRREADRLIERGMVKINGRKAKLGDQVFEADKVEVTKEARNALENFVYYAYNKPVGIVSHSAEEGQKDIKDALKFKLRHPDNGGIIERVFPVGRLDRDSQGLIILTNDGRITDKLLNPKFRHEKEYLVTVDKDIKNHLLNVLKKGVNIEGYKTLPSKAWQIGPRNFRIVIFEGKRHQIRRMCAALDYRVTGLKRIRIMNIKLENLKVGEYRKVEGEELKKFLEELGIK